MGIALIADESVEVGNLSQIEKDLGEAVTLAQPQAKAKVVESKVQDDEQLPDKYRGKSAKDIAEMHMNAESALGRMANDLGTQRKLTDRLLDLKRDDDLSRNTPPSKLTRAELLESDDPTPVLDKFVEARVSRVQNETNERLSRMEQSLAATTFAAKHPDYGTLANDREFITWAQATSYRTRLAAQAVQQNDWMAADELLSEYKAQKPRKPADDLETDSPLEAARVAALESGSTAEKSAGGKAGKIYRRTDLIRLRTENPEAYYSDDFQAVILKAYAEKRVR